MIKWCLTVLLALIPMGALADGVAKVTIDMAIGPISNQIIADAIEEAIDDDRQLLIIEMDTPGGLETSMRLTCRQLLNADIPVVVFVSPSGARAASAGVFIAYSAHFAAMAPGTNIGAAHVVSMGGSMDSVMSEKVQNDAVAYITSIAKQRGRNVEWAISAVEESVSIDAETALDSNVIDIIAKDIEDLLTQLDGREVELTNRTDTLHVAGAVVTDFEITFRDRFLTVITNPSIAFILFNIGWMGLMLELYNPGSLVPGIVGGICLLLAFFAFQQLPINYAGLGLIIFAIILFVLEVKIVSYGMLGIGGVISMLLGSLMLIDSPAPFLQISLTVIIVTVASIAGFFLFLIYFVVRAYNTQVTTGREGMVGREGEVREGGMVMVVGELWKPVCDEPLKEGDLVRVLSMENLKIKVEKIGRST